MQSKVALITGAARGIGLGIATCLARKGARIVIADMNGDSARQSADLHATGWVHVHDVLRRAVAPEPRAVREFSDECRFWVARKPAEN